MIEPIAPGCRWALAVKAYVDGRLSKEMKERVREHLVDCKACGATFGAAVERAVLAESPRPSLWRAAGRVIAGAVRRLVTWFGGSNG